MYAYTLCVIVTGKVNKQDVNQNTVAVKNLYIRTKKVVLLYKIKMEGKDLLKSYNNQVVKKERKRFCDLVININILIPLTTGDLGSQF